MVFFFTLFPSHICTSHLLHPPNLLTIRFSILILIFFRQASEAFCMYNIHTDFHICLAQSLVPFSKSKTNVSSRWAKPDAFERGARVCAESKKPFAREKRSIAKLVASRERRTQGGGWGGGGGPWSILFFMMYARLASMYSRLWRRQRKKERRRRREGKEQAALRARIWSQRRGALLSIWLAWCPSG